MAAFSTTLAEAGTRVKPGIEVLLEKRMDLIRGKRVGLITNPTGVDSKLESTIDLLHGDPEVRLTALFGPEHGVRGDIPGGEKIKSFRDKRTGVQVFSLYGGVRKPTPEMLGNVDVLLYDIQDIGSRAYTYIYTMAQSMEAARDAGIPFIVLDRPNPLGGELMEGPMLDPRFKSFIGLYPIPYIYGLTVGELAQVFNAEFGIGADLTVVPMEGWTRRMRYDDTGLPWVPTSPHIPHAATAMFCATTGIIGELGTVSEGVGYTSPFEQIGAPWVVPDELADHLNRLRLSGVIFRPLFYRPYYFRFIEERVGGVHIHITDPTTFSPMRVQLHIIEALIRLYPEHDIFDSPRLTSFDKAMGTDAVRKALARGVPVSEIMSEWDDELSKFRQKAGKYRIY